jgi:hypothetical protein
MQTTPRHAIASLFIVTTTLAACGNKSTESASSESPSGGPAASGAAAANAGTKTCCEDYPYCVTLPAGWTVQKPMKGDGWTNCAVMDEKKKQVATLYTNKADGYDGAILGDKSFMDAGSNQKNEPIADGKGVYHEWNYREDPDRKGRDHQIEAYVKSDKLWHCEGATDKNDTGALAGQLEKVCKSMAAK